jgi:predicted helicase
LQKSDIDSFFTASGKKIFGGRMIISTTNNWSRHAEEALEDQRTPVTVIYLSDLGNSQIDWNSINFGTDAARLKPKKVLRDHQKLAVKDVCEGFNNSDRGQLLMACGTGKTFTSLKIAECVAGAGGKVLFLVPSLALLSQALTEWTQESEIPLDSFAVCSDDDVGKKKSRSDDSLSVHISELRYPATTKADQLAKEFNGRHVSNHMGVVFGTYHSIAVISDAQRKYGFPKFDLIICDEAHRTTGVALDDNDESHFTRVHNGDYIRGEKRLYMTATPRVYTDSAKARAKGGDIEMFSMDNGATYGPVFHTITFSEAVRRGLLVDYKVIVLSVPESFASRRLQSLLSDENNQLRVDDAAKIIGCWKALAKYGLEGDLPDGSHSMRRAVAFCQVIEKSRGNVHKVKSKEIVEMFPKVVEAYKSADLEDGAIDLTCEVEHIDGMMNAAQKEEKLSWLRDDLPPNTCRILSNVRCLSEGVDVPSLDAVLFLAPRKSQVDVIQAVGRVMRTSPGKKLGYIILPIVVPVGMDPYEALDNNDIYAVVWQVLKALKAHDNRFDAMINKLDLTSAWLDQMEIIIVGDPIFQKTSPKSPGVGNFSIGTEAVLEDSSQLTLGSMQIEIGDLERAMRAKIVDKVGNRCHWEDWANDIAQIANRHIDRIKGILENEKNVREREAFFNFADELRDDLNDSISDDEVIEMLAQHMITQPVFEALFKDYSFAKNNQVSVAMQKILEILHEHHLEKEADTLQGFYDDVKMRAEGIDNAAGRQKIILELYNKFFQNAFPKMAERLGIVYTPIEIVDFILHSVDHLLRMEFGETFSSENVKIIDPFVGTRTFITRLLQSGLISKEALAGKYKSDIYANEIVLLAYYIAATNIESTYHDLVGGEYQPFNGICLTDTFQLHEKDDLISQMLVENSDRRIREKSTDIHIIVSNPPYSIGQKSANDNNANVKYQNLDSRICKTYMKRSVKHNKRSLYDSYIRAVRWASDRIGKRGIIGFVTNAGFLDSASADGMRKCLAEEFSNIYIFHLRGNARTSGELRRKESGNVFGEGSRSPVAISMLVKNPHSAEHGRIYFHDIGDYLNREEKLEKIKIFSDISGIARADGWKIITPDEHGDWLNQRTPEFKSHIPLGSKNAAEKVKLFENYSRGIATSRDAWCYNASKGHLGENMERMINFYNGEVNRIFNEFPTLGKKDLVDNVDKFINLDKSKISWAYGLKKSLLLGKRFNFSEKPIVQSLYRPFTKQWCYFDRNFNECVYQMPCIFPNGSAENRVICVPGIGAKCEFSALIANVLPCLDNIEKGQCFPLYLYDKPCKSPESGSMEQDFFDGTNGKILQTRRSAITAEGLKHFRMAYPAEDISAEDIFYYVYGILHSPDYREHFANNLSKELPRIPRVKSATDFWAFASAGMKLADLHINYETAEKYPLEIVAKGDLTDKDFAVEKKIRYGTNRDKTTLIYNHKITLRGVPIEVQDYIVNGKSALDWVIERQCVSVDKDSGITNDANRWAVETAHNPKYPLELLQRVTTVSMKTLKIAKNLPKLDV